MRAQRIPASVIAAVLILAIAACSSSPKPAAPVTRAPPASADDPSSSMVVGVYEPYAPGSYWQIGAFAAAVGQWPKIVSYYGNWGMPFQSVFAEQAWGHGGETLVQIHPRAVSLGAIASGQYDNYLRAYASAVRNFGHQIIISFGQEMNGDWYQWGTGRTAPATFIAAWRHIVDIFRVDGTRNVTWLWDVNCSFPHSSPISQWWPGASYVSWVGVDCYYAHSSDTFDSLFGSTIDDARHITSDPILIAETAAGPVAGPSKIADLFNGARNDHVLGIVWFDQAQNDGISHQNWRLEDRPTALAAFRQALAALTN